MTEHAPQKIRLQSVGWVPAVEAHELKVGDQRRYNFDRVGQITKIEEASPKFLKITKVSSETGEEHTDRVKKTSLIARMPENFRRPLGHETAPATAYRAQVRAPEHGEWITVSYGATVEAAVSGSTRTGHRSSFDSTMLDRHGLGYSAAKPNGRAESIEAMAEGKTLTAEDGHAFRILPPERPEESGPISAAEIEAEFGPGALEEGRQIAREVFAEVAAEEAKEKEAARTLPALEGHTITAALTGSMWTVALYADGNAEPLLTDRIGDHVTDGPACAARVLISARTAAMKEAAALLALEDETLYEVCEYRASIPTQDPATMTGREARARLAAAREEAGPEPLRSYGAPRFTVEHSGASWWTTMHAYTTAGHLDMWHDRHISVRPLVVAEAMHVLMSATGDGCVGPVEKPGINAYGPWVRAVAGSPDLVAVARVSTGLPQRPQHEPAATRWDECMTTYRGAMEAAGWTFQSTLDDSAMVFQKPAAQQ